MGAEELILLGNFGDIHVPDHRQIFIPREKNVGTFNVSMDDVLLVQDLEACEVNRILGYLPLQIYSSHFQI